VRAFLFKFYLSFFLSEHLVLKSCMKPCGSEWQYGKQEIDLPLPRNESGRSRKENGAQHNQGVIKRAQTMVYGYE
jgi:hypothetical protein